LRDVLKRFYAVEAEVTVSDPQRPPLASELASKERNACGSDGKPLWDNAC